MTLYGHLQERRPDEKPVTIATLATMREQGEPIACITAYDASFAHLVDVAGIDVVLVGDSLGMVIQGHDTTVPVTVDDMVYHTRCVARGLQRPFLIADMPFGSYALPEPAFYNAARLHTDGVIRFADIREVLATAFEVSLLKPIPDTILGNFHF